MLKNLFYFSFAIIALLTLNNCSKNLEGMTILEKSIYQPDRFSDDDDNDERRKPLSILKFSGIKPGDTVVDLLGGGGYYTELFNYIVGDKGKVYIQNNSLFLRFVDKPLTKRLKGGRLKNAVRIDSEFADMKLPKNVDLIFIGLSYHDIYVKREDPKLYSNSKEFFPQLYAALKPGGKIVVIDHAAKPGSGINNISKLHRIDEQWTKKEFEKAGFKLVKTLDVLRNPKDNYDLDIWEKEVYYKTDRFVHLYEKPAS